MNDGQPDPHASETVGAQQRAGLLDGLFDRALGLSGVLIWGIALGIFVNVVLRRFVGLELSWLFEVTEYLLLVIAFLGGAALLRDRGHVTVDLIGEVVLTRAKRVVTRIGDVLTTVILAVLAAVSALMTYRNARTGQITPGVVEIPRWWIYAVIPVGLTLMFVQAVRTLLRPAPADEAITSDDPAEQYPV